MNLQDLLALHPKIHLDERGEDHSWAIADEVLAYLEKIVQPGWRTLETGSGLSTIVFAMRGAHHTAITPAASEFTKIRDFCSRHALSLERVEMIEGRSEFVLPSLDREDLDLVLVDGRHGFPAPFIDWFYGAAALRVSGLMLIDDTQLWTGRVLHDFLDAEPHWRTVEILGKTTVFEKTSDRIHDGEWNEQPYILGRQS